MRLSDCSSDVCSSARIAAGGLQGPRQPYDAALAKQTLKSAGVTAMLLHDEFLVGMTVEGNAAASRAARCRSFGWMLDALHDVPMEQRVAAPRLLLTAGLSPLPPRGPGVVGCPAAKARAGTGNREGGKE